MVDSIEIQILGRERRMIVMDSLFSFVERQIAALLATSNAAEKSTRG
ncbi:MAG: hypothetical protein NVV63_02250 [Opitutus sp.]|nr:hypothetical protein [Opitutus sp.]